MILNSEDKINFFISKHQELNDFEFKNIEGGKNNKSFVLESKQGQKYFLKEYFTDKSDKRNRLKVEWDFLKLSEELNINSTPTTIIKDEKLNLALYSFIEGQKIVPHAITEHHIDKVLKFIISLNSNTNHSSFSHKASDFNNSIHTFITSMDARVNNLNFINDLDFELKIKLVKLREDIKNIWRKEKTYLNTIFNKNEIYSEFPLFLSPSDIGFHNILINKNENLFFIDFEYAGLDDLAKLTNDFFSCPDIMIPKRFKKSFISKLICSLEIDNFFETRVIALEESFKIKWACILLNEYLVHGMNRRMFSNGNTDYKLSSFQYQKSIDLLLN